MRRFSIVVGTLILLGLVATLQSGTSVQLTQAEQALVAEHVFGGVPSAGDLHVRQAYVMSYDSARRVPAWVAYHVVADYRNTPPRRGRFSSFRTDPDLTNPVRRQDYNGLLAARGRNTFFLCGLRNE